VVTPPDTEEPPVFAVPELVMCSACGLAQLPFPATNCTPSRNATLAHDKYDSKIGKEISELLSRRRRHR
jgi:hypothetical protein